MKETYIWLKTFIFCNHKKTRNISYLAKKSCKTLVRLTLWWFAKELFQYHNFLVRMWVLQGSANIINVDKKSFNKLTLNIIVWWHLIWVLIYWLCYFLKKQFYINKLQKYTPKRREYFLLMNFRKINDDHVWCLKKLSFSCILNLIGWKSSL